MSTDKTFQMVADKMFMTKRSQRIIHYSNPKHNTESNFRIKVGFSVTFRVRVVYDSLWTFRHEHFVG